MHKKATIATGESEPSRPQAGWPDRPVAHRQLVLVTVPWQLGGGRAGVGAPRDRVLADALDTHTRRYATAAGWDPPMISKIRSGIRLLLGMQDTPGAAILYTDTKILAQVFIPQRLVVAVLDDVGMITDDRIPSVVSWFERQVEGLSDTMVTELRVWFDVMHHGSATPPRRKPRAVNTIKSYLTSVLPILRSWADHGRESLREITRTDIAGAIPTTDPDRAMAGRGLRSIFSILKARKVIFANPARQLDTRIDYTMVPNLADLDGVRTALASPNPARAVVAALAAYHALKTSQLRHLKVTDLRDRRLHLDRRVILLAEPVKRRIVTWLHHRQSRWPHSTNPYLFIHFRTAARTEPVGRRWIKLTIDLPGGVQRLRQDRILQEAIWSDGDPRRLSDLFGISIEQATHYTRTLDEPDQIATEVTEQ